MKKWIVLIAFFSSIIELSAQVDSNWIRIEHHWYGARFFHNEQPIAMSDLIEISEGRLSSNALFRKANNRHDFARFSQAAGAFLILYPIVNQAIGREPNWNMVYIGAGLWGLSIPIELSSRHLATQAVMLYNKQSKQEGIKLDIDPLRFRIALRF